MHVHNRYAREKIWPVLKNAAIPAAMAGKSPQTKWCRQTANLTPDLAARGEQRWKALGLSSWTDYIKSLIESDLAERPVLIRSEDGATFATVLRPLPPAAAFTYGFLREPTPTLAAEPTPAEAAILRATAAAQPRPQATSPATQPAR